MTSTSTKPRYTTKQTRDGWWMVLDNKTVKGVTYRRTEAEVQAIADKMNAEVK